MKKKISNLELQKAAGGYEEEQQPLHRVTRYKVCAVCGEQYEASKAACPKCGSTSTK